MQEVQGINLSLVTAPQAGWVRLSLAYLYVVELAGKYLLVFNDNTKAPKYQPLGGAYQCPEVTYAYLQRNYHLRSGQRRPTYEAPGAHDYRFLLPLVEVKPFLYDFLLGDLAPIEEEDPAVRRRLWQEMEAYGVCAPDFLLDRPVYQALKDLIACGIKHHCWSRQLALLQQAWSWPRALDLQAFGLKGPVRTWDELEALGQREYILDTCRELSEELADTKLFTAEELKHFSWVESDYLGRSYSVAFDEGFQCPSLMLTDCLRVQVSPELHKLFALALERQAEQPGFKPLRLCTQAEIRASMVARTQAPSLDPQHPSCADHCRFILHEAKLHLPKSLQGS